jgi:NADH-quinone oxidoreductase subunit J
MTILFFLGAAITLAGTIGAMSLRNPIHCILSLAAGLVGVAGVYLSLGAQFVGFTQVLVYVGAVAILAVFALMMTRSEEESLRERLLRASTSSIVASVSITVLVLATFAWAIALQHGASASSVMPTATVAQIGDELLHTYALPLELIGLMLTVALIGAVIVALPKKEEGR